MSNQALFLTKPDKAAIIVVILAVLSVTNLCNGLDVLGLRLGESKMSPNALSEMRSLVSCRPGYADEKKEKESEFYKAYLECDKFVSNPVPPSLDGKTISKINNTATCLHLCAIKRMKFVEKNAPNSGNLENAGEQIYPGSSDIAIESQKSFREDFIICFDKHKPTGSSKNGCYENKSFVVCCRGRNNAQCKNQTQTVQTVQNDDGF